MSSASIATRRATLDDLAKLKPLWSNAVLLETDVEKRLTEFQVAEEASGSIVGCVGLRMMDQQGRIHSELYIDSEARSQVQTLLWDRILNLARNFALTRLWVQSKDPFWNSVGFRQIDAAAQGELPPIVTEGGATQRANDAPWLVLVLRDSNAASAIEREFDLLRQVQEAQTTRTMRQVRALRVIAVVMAVVTLILICLAIWAISRRL